MIVRPGPKPTLLFPPSRAWAYLKYAWRNKNGNPIEIGV